MTYSHQVTGAKIQSFATNMSASLGGPPELEEAIKDFFSYDELPTCGVFRLLFDGRERNGDYTWGFRIYRTSYKRPDSNARFAKAIDVLNEYIRYECFSSKDSRNETVPPDNGKASEQLWRRLRHDIVEDCELLEGASETPAKILELAQNWVHYEKKAVTGDSPRYRFFLVVDDEVIDHLLQLPTPATYQRNIPSVYSVKVYDARFNSPPEFSGGESDSESDTDSDCAGTDEALESFEGWFWTSARKLAQLWFCEDDLPLEELIHVDDSWDATDRFVPGTVALSFGLPLIERRRELRALKKAQDSAK